MFERTPRWFAPLGLGLGLIALLWAPGRWLVAGWLDPAVEGGGPWIALGCLALAARSWASGPAPGDARAARLALALLAVTTGVRLAGQVLAVRLVGGLALVVDIAALALALRLHRRPWPVHPAALAALFACALPLAQTAQRLFGFPLRLASAALAEGALRPLFPALVREGALLRHPGVDLLVDLPCSGAEGLALLAAVGAGIACRRRLGPGRAATLLGLIVGGALLANAARVALLFVGARAGWPVFEGAAHDLIGLVALALGAAPLLWAAARWPARRVAPIAAPSPPPRLRPLPAWLFAAAALGVSAAPARPLDVGAPLPPPELPAHLGDWRREDAALTSLEAAYFTRFGGAARKAHFADDRGAPIGVLVVRTQAPLRHLHGPDRCLRGAGFSVERLGVRAGVPEVLWRATGPDGRVWRVETLFVDDAGHTAATVGEVAWRWARAPRATWSLVQRTTPWTTCEAAPARCADFAAGLARALDLPTEEAPR